jgi:hypothetical protein
LKQFEKKSHLIIDKIQYAPSLFRELKIRIDEDRNRFGRWILTVSQTFSLMENVSESLAGRIGILHLETLSAEELRNRGFFNKVKGVLKEHAASLPAGQENLFQSALKIIRW